MPSKNKVHTIKFYFYTTPKCTILMEPLFSSSSDRSEITTKKKYKRRKLVACLIINICFLIKAISGLTMNRIVAVDQKCVLNRNIFIGSID